jgi:hypothetical protein
MRYSDQKRCHDGGVTCHVEGVRYVVNRSVKVVPDGERASWSGNSKVPSRANQYGQHAYEAETFSNSLKINMRT